MLKMQVQVQMQMQMITASKDFIPTPVCQCVWHFGKHGRP